VEQVVAERQRHRLAGDELAPDQERLRDAFGPRLGGVADREPERGAVAEQALEERQVGRRADQQQLPDARQHQGRERVVDHRLVVDRQQLLAHAARDRVQPRAGAAGQDDALQRRREPVSAAPPAG
jgi:hypothetical protein